MDEALRAKRLKLALRVIGTFFIVAFLGFYVLVLLDSPLAAEGSLIGALLRWTPYHKAYEGMIVAVYSVWGIFLWKASGNPAEHKSLIDFTIWGNLAHAIFMFAASFLITGETIHVVGDVLTLGLIAGVLSWLRPRSIRATASA